MVGATALATMPNEKETVGSFRYSSLWPLLEFLVFLPSNITPFFFWLFTVPRFEPTVSCVKPYMPYHQCVSPAQDNSLESRYR